MCVSSGTRARSIWPVQSSCLSSSPPAFITVQLGVLSLPASQLLKPCIAHQGASAQYRVMQVFVREGRHVAVEAEVDSTVADVKAAYLQKACGGLHSDIVSTERCTF